MNNELEQRYLNVINDNVNVGKSNVLCEFVILVAGLILMCLLIYIFADKISAFLIDRISAKTQVKIEKIFPDPKFPEVENPSEKILFLEKIKPQIIAMDKNLQNKSKFNIYQTPDEEINAFVTANGTIYFTEGMLKKVDDEKTLAFVLAHEMGHYANRDHLKAISRELIAAILYSVITLGQKDLESSVGSIATIGSLNYSRRQEKQADIYAAKVIYKLYGNLDGAENFFNILESEKEIPELYKYFSTHPSNKDRLRIIKNIKRKY